MGRGLKYCLKPELRASSLRGFAVEMDVAIESVSKDFSIKNHIRNDVFAEICKVRGGLPERERSLIKHTNLKILKSIKDKIKNESLTITKADRGNCLVILNKGDYISKVETFLCENSFHKLNKNPLMKYKKQLDGIIKTLAPF